VVTELLKRGAVVDAATKKGNTALHIASLGKTHHCKNVSKETVTHFLMPSADIYVTDSVCFLRNKNF
jgi:ankyrin repeat protein